MRSVWNIILKGIATVLPVGLTLYIIYWLGISVEKIFHLIMSAVLPEQYYHPGMGLVAGFVLLFLIGLAVNAWIVRRLFQFSDELLERIPLIKSVYGTLRDFTEYFFVAGHHHETQPVVLIKFGDVRMIGILTSKNVDEIPASDKLDNMVAVYIPMSYQIGGYTVYVPKTHVEVLDMRFEDAMRDVITAGLSKKGSNKAGRL